MTRKKSSREEEVQTPPEPPPVMGRMAHVVCPGCNRIMSPSMDFKTCTCILKSCEHYGVYFEAPALPLVPVNKEQTP